MWIQSNNWLVNFGFTNLHLLTRLKSNHTYTRQQCHRNAAIHYSTFPSKLSSLSILIHHSHASVCSGLKEGKCFDCTLKGNHINTATYAWLACRGTANIQAQSQVPQDSTSRRTGNCASNDGSAHQPAACRPVCKAALSKQWTTGLYSFLCHTSTWR